VLGSSTEQEIVIMTSPVRKLLLWSPRILGILVALFLGVFALDAIGEGFPALLLHAAPTLLLLVVVAVSWRWEWVGGAVFIVFAALVGVVAWARGGWWNLVICVPLLAVGVLFLWSWRHHKELRAHS
jgi:hypothetical protein